MHFNCTGDEIVNSEDWVCVLCCKHNSKNWVFDDIQHIGTCSACGKQVTGEHEHDRYEITKEPTCQADGVKTYLCICGHGNEESIPMLKDHVYGDWIKTDTHHTRKCTHCQQEQSKEHEWDEGHTIRKPSCAVEGTKKYTCRTCKATRIEEIEKTDEHRYDGATDEKCNVCGHTRQLEDNSGNGAGNQSDNDRDEQDSTVLVIMIAVAAVVVAGGVTVVVLRKRKK